MNKKKKILEMGVSSITDITDATDFSGLYITDDDASDFSGLYIKILKVPFLQMATHNPSLLNCFIDRKNICLILLLYRHQIPEKTLTLTLTLF